ncbi:hypothetical protein DRW03_25110 [Corallococcus sp. H22C18031201]|nr:hypothetical protein DRW03_25110 [Corallococcus sp. H22C18031201]
MSGRDGPGAQRRAARAPGRSFALAQLRAWSLTVVSSAALGLLLYVVSSSLPFVIVSPSSDTNLGALNRCLFRALGERTRLGWAVSPDASRAAVFGPRVVAVCDLQGGLFREEVPGATALTFDGAQRLWVAAGHRLLREEGGALRPVGDFSPPVSLAGHASGVLALDASGQLVSVSPEGAVLGQVMLPGPGGRLSVGPGGTLATVVWGGWVLAYEARTLTPLLPARAPPCPVESLWWLDAPSEVLVACVAGTPPDAGAPQASFILDVRLGTSRAAPSRPRAPARRLLGRALYVHACDGFPCTAPAP